MHTLEGLLRDDGENLAVRDFLMAYSGLTDYNRVARMREYMSTCGWHGLWPAWVDSSLSSSTLTKAGAQDWLRYLFTLEAHVPVAAPPSLDEASFVPWTPELLERYLQQAASEGIPTISNVRYLDATPLKDLP